MKISVAMATYNGEKYITEQLDSLKNQTLPPDEVVICDDRSSDNTVNIVNEYIEKHGLQNKWTISINAENMGYANNFNRAIGKCEGDIIFFCDQDDVWHLDKIEVMTNIMEKNSDIQVLFSEFTNFYSNEKTPHDIATEYNEESVCKIELNSKNMYLQAPGCVMALRSAFVRNMGKYWYSEFAHDEFAWKMALCKDGLYKCNLNLIERRCHGNNTSMRKMRALKERISYVENLEKSYNAMRLCLCDCPSKDEKKLNLINHNIKASVIRKKMLIERKVYYIPLLLFLYSDAFKTIKTIFMEAYLSLKGDCHE